MDNQTIMFEKESLERLKRPLTCPICNNKWKEATTIKECLQTFCRECIYRKLQAEGIKSCPQCNLDLSSMSPENYLRPNERFRKIIKATFGNSEGSSSSGSNQHSVVQREKSLWFSLIPQADETGHAYPKLERPYIRIKNANQSSSSMINRYLKNKLGLASEDEVEVCCFGEPLTEGLTLAGVVNICVDGSISSKNHFMSKNLNELEAKDFVMELSYRRKKN